MKIFVLSKRISGNGKHGLSCEVFLREKAAREAADEDIKASIQVCAEKYGINPHKVEPKNNQGATIAWMRDDTYIWKIKETETNLKPGNTAFILLHAHNGGYVDYAESCVFADMESAKVAMSASFQSALEMWRLMKGKSLFRSVESAIEEDSAQIQLESTVEIWTITERRIPAADPAQVN